MDMLLCVNCHFFVCWIYFVCKETIDIVIHLDLFSFLNFPMSTAHVKRRVSAPDPPTENHCFPPIFPG